VAGDVGDAVAAEFVGVEGEQPAGVAGDVAADEEPGLLAGAADAGAVRVRVGSS